MVYAKHVQRDGTSIKITPAFLLVTSVPPGTKLQVLVRPATMDPSSSMEIVLLMSIPVLYLNQTFYARPGQKKAVLLAQIEASSTKMDCVLLLALNVTVSIRLLETVLPASLDMISFKENVFTHPPILPHQVTLDAELGTGTTKYVLLALKTGLSMLKKSVSLSLINVELMMLTDTVLNVTKVMILKKVNVFSLFPTMPNLPIKDVELGIGIIKFVLLALKDGSSMLTQSVLQFLINVKLMPKMETVPLVIKDMILNKDNVCSLNSIMLDRLIWDVLPGIGITKSVSLALKIGSSTKTKSVFQYLINVKLMPIMVTVPLVIKAMI